MNEKTTKPDTDLNARKMEFLDRLTDFAEHAKRVLIKISLWQAIDTFDFDDPSKKMRKIFLHEKSWGFILVFYLDEESDDWIAINIDKHGGIDIQFPVKPDVLAKCADIPFNHFIHLFENAMDTQNILNERPSNKTKG